MAVVSGFDSSESVVVSVDGTEYPARNAANGQRTISWRCSNGGSPLSFIARGLSSGLRIDFSVQTNGRVIPTQPPPPCSVAVKRQYPGNEVIDHLIVTQHAASFSQPLEPFENGCRGTIRESFDEGERVQSKGFAGGYLELVGGGWIRTSATRSPNSGSGPGVDDIQVSSWPANDNVLVEARDILAAEIEAIGSDEADITDLIDPSADRELKTLCAIAYFKGRRLYDLNPSNASSGVRCLLDLMNDMKRRQVFNEYLTAIGAYAEAVAYALEGFIENPLLQFFGVTDAVYCAGNGILSIDPNSTGSSFGKGVCINTAAGVILAPVMKLGKLARWFKRGKNNPRIPALLGAGTPGTVIKNFLNDEEERFAKRVVGFMGGEFRGAPTSNFAGIDGWLDGAPASLKSRLRTTSPTAISNAAREAGDKAANAEIGRVLVFIEAPKISKQLLLEGPILNVLHQQKPWLKSITVFCEDGVLNFVNVRR